MHVQIHDPTARIEEIHGFTVVVDVLRAFSVAYFIEKATPGKYIVVNDIEIAFDLKEKFKSVILIGERSGVKIPGFDFGNSPTEILNQNFSNHIVVHTTSAGTNGLIKQSRKNLVVVGSFVNFSSIVKYVLNNNIEIVNIYCTASRGDIFGLEDYLFAEHLRESLLSGFVEYDEIRTKIFDINKEGFSESGFAPRTDLLLCLDINKFDSLLTPVPCTLDNKLLELRKLA